MDTDKHGFVLERGSVSRSNVETKAMAKLLRLTEPRSGIGVHLC
jgi:hypothetical protein